MPEESKESKAARLAAARKKLKEYQQRVNASDGGNSTASETPAEHFSRTPTASVSSNLSEKSDSELNINNVSTIPGAKTTATTSNQQIGTTKLPTTSTAEVEVFQGVESSMMDIPIQHSITNYFAIPEPSEPRGSESVLDQQQAFPSPHIQQQQEQQNLQTLHLLINEKAQLTSELNKSRILNSEKDLELEGLRMQYQEQTHRFDELQQRLGQQQQSIDNLRHTNAELQHKLAQAHAANEDQAEHIKEIKGLLEEMQKRAIELENQHKEKCNELEMAQIRIQQLSDVSHIDKDNQVESLQQAQFVHEQQIRDLQAMVHQLGHDKEQANTQYQNYTEHLNAEIMKLNERNSELTEECCHLQERERQLVEHISGLEKEIQKTLTRQQEIKYEGEKELNWPQNVLQLEEQVRQLKNQLSTYDAERHEFLLKIKSQEDRLESLQQQLQQKDMDVLALKEELERLSQEQPNQVRLLATMESDKVAASRALTQNQELKKQMDELELRFVQLTNDKAELINKLDAEEHANRTMRANYHAMEERVRDIDERFKFKDEEMIRLSHENMELQQQIATLKYSTHQENIRVNGVEEDAPGETEVNEHNDRPNDDHDRDHLHHHRHVHSSASNCQEAVEVDPLFNNKATSCVQEDVVVKHATSSFQGPQIPNEEALFKLQQRFARLISQMADLTDEKQRLEHLVLQLQSETETIGEYITLYQQQRRILKQREYEKAAQMQLLQEEREQLRDKINILNNLVSTLGGELPHNTVWKEELQKAMSQSSDVPVVQAAGREVVQQIQEGDQEKAINEKLNSNESLEILNKIQNIITEMKENTTKDLTSVSHLQAADHLHCCMGNLETV